VFGVLGVFGWGGDYIMLHNNFKLLIFI